MTNSEERRFDGLESKSSYPEGLTDQTGTGPLPIGSLLCIFLEKFVDILVILGLTIYAISSEPVLHIIEEHFWPMVAVTVILMIALLLMYQVAWLRAFPGFVLYKFVYLAFLTAFFFLLTVHLPIPFEYLSQYFALVAEGSVATFYLFFAFMTVTHTKICTIPEKGCIFWLIFMAMPIGMLVVTQLIYFTYGISYIRGYWDVSLSIATGIVTALPFYFEALYIYKRYVGATSLEEFSRTTVLLPGFMTARFASKQYTNRRPVAV